MKKAFLFLSAILMAMVFTSCKPDNYLYGLQWHEAELYEGAPHYVIDFFSKDSCEIRFYGYSGYLESEEHQPYYIKNKTTFYVGSKSSINEYEYNPNNNRIKYIVLKRTYYPKRTIVNR